MTSRPGMRRRGLAGRPAGFTLVELLVVVAIFGILLAMTAPVVLQAREQSAVAPCTSNVRQVTLAMLAYAADHEGELPLSYRDPAGRLVGADLWEKILPYLPGRDIRNREEAAAEYRCPLAARRGWTHLGTGEPATIAANHVLSNIQATNAPATFSSLIQRPVSAMLLADSSGWSEAWGGTLSGSVSASVPPAFLHGGRSKTRGGNGNGQWYYFREGMTVFGFADGHVTMLPTNTITLGDTSTTTGRLFWAGREQW